MIMMTDKKQNVNFIIFVRFTTWNTVTGMETSISKNGNNWTKMSSGCYMWIKSKILIDKDHRNCAFCESLKFEPCSTRAWLKRNIIFSKDCSQWQLSLHHLVSISYCKPPFLVTPLYTMNHTGSLQYITYWWQPS